MTNFDELKAKIQKVAEDNDLVFIFDASCSPIRFIFKEAEDAQCRFDDTDEQEQAKKPALKFIFRDGITVKADNNFVLSDEVYNKLKNLCKKMHYLFLLKYHYWLEAKGMNEDKRDKHVEDRADQDLLTEYITQRSF